MIRAGIGPLQDEEGNLEQSNKQMCELLNEQYNSVFSTPDPTMTIKYSKDFFGHPRAYALSELQTVLIFLCRLLRSSIWGTSVAAKVASLLVGSSSWVSYLLSLLCVLCFPWTGVLCPSNEVIQIVQCIVCIEILWLIMHI